MLFIVPFTIFSSFIFIDQFHKSIKIFTLYFKAKQQDDQQNELIKTDHDSFCGRFLFNVDDETEIIFSQCDFDYVLNLANEHKNNQKLITSNLAINQTSMNLKSIVKYDQYKYSKVVQIKHETKMNKLIKKYVYDWNENFRFTSRFINIISVATVTLYYFVLTLFYFYTIYSEIFINLYTLVLEQFYILQLILNSIIIIDYLRMVIMIPIFVAAFFSFTQLALLVIETKRYLMEMYKGKCEFITSKKMSKNKVGIMSLSFGGYLVGFLIWGYLILYAFLVVVGILVYIIDNFITFGYLFERFYKLIIQFVAVYFIKFVVKKIMFYFFVETDSKILALNNFRAYNIVLYFMFFFDLFFGFLNAIVRLLKGIFASALMMSRKLN